MSQLDTIAIRCECPERLVEDLQTVQSQLPQEAKIQFNRITLAYMELYGIDGFFERVNNRSVAQILIEFNPKEHATLDWMDDATPIAASERDGVRWELHDAPDARDAKGKR